jgi:hypothetical protein
MAFLRVLDAPAEGAQGTLNQQLTPYNYVGQEVSVGKVQQLTVLAGSFSATVNADLKVGEVGVILLPSRPHVSRAALPSAR